MKPLRDQVMLITGASSGIGLITARTAAARGAKVVLVARNEPALREIASEIERSGGAAEWAVADVGALDQVRAAADKAVARFGRIDTWVNCAGVAIYAKLTETPPDEHERLFRTNYFGVVNGALTAVEHLRGRGGAIVTVGSIAGDLASPIMGAYGATKHAVRGFIESLRIELKADGLPIAVTLIKPSGMATPIAAHAANHVAGEARVPPPSYDPELAAEAILDAAEHARMDVTVGGVGRLLVLLATHFPAAHARLAGMVAPLLHDPAQPKTAGSNLYRPGFAGEERSRLDRGRRFSLYAIAGRHPHASALAALGLAGGGALLRARPRFLR